MPASRFPEVGSTVQTKSVAAPETGHGSARLPRPLTPLVARETDVATVAALLRDPAIRLLTLTGPGGVGKTRLAIAAAEAAAFAFSDDVVFVDLSPVGDPGLVVSTIARCLGLRDVGAEALANRLLTAVADRRMLIVLDNFEQVVVAAPRLLEILDACPALVLLVTSRTRLRISGEREFPVSPLALDSGFPAMDDLPSAAVRLFAERARATRPDFGLTAETQPIVADIVGRLDGLPLAIELAAARTKALPPAALLRRLEQRLPMLKGGARDLPLRQQTMRDTIGWSYDLLDAAEQDLFRRLGVFVGGFTLDAAEAIGAVPASEASGRAQDRPRDALDGVIALVEHSLLRPNLGPEGEPRYQMLETVREFALERLAATGEAAAVRRAHAAWCLDLAEAAQPALWGGSHATWLDRLAREKDNLRAATNWAMESGDGESAARLAAALWRFWQRRGYMGEGRSLLAGILALPSVDAASAAGCGALTGAAVLAAFQGDYDQAVRHAEAALAGWRRLGDQRGIAKMLLCLATVARFRDDYATAEARGRESLAVFRAVNDRWGIGHALTHLGMVARVQGNHAAGADAYQEALAHLRAIDDESGVFDIVLELGKAACDDGDFDLATSRFEECLALAAALGDRGQRGAVLTELGVVARLRGDLDRSAELLAESAELAREHGDRRQIAYLAAHRGDVAIAGGDVAAAAARYAEALGPFLAMGNRVGAAHGLESIARCATARGRDTAAVRLFASCSALFDAVGATPSPDRVPAVEAASLRSRMSSAEFARAWDAGLALAPADAAAEAMALAADLAEGGPIAATPRPRGAAVHTPAPGEPPATAEALGLTPREVDVLRLLADGMSDRQIAAALSISERTAGNHVQHAMQKIGVESRTAAAVFAVRHGLC